MNKCKNCGGEMKALLTSTYCVAECDKKTHMGLPSMKLFELDVKDFEITNCVSDSFDFCIPLNTISTIEIKDCYVQNDSLETMFRYTHAFPKIKQYNTSNSIEARARFAYGMPKIKQYNIGMIADELTKCDEDAQYFKSKLFAALKIPNSKDNLETPRFAYEPPKIKQYSVGMIADELIEEENKDGMD